MTSPKRTHVHFNHHSTEDKHIWLILIGLSFERPILGDNPKAHAENCMKSSGFHENCYFSWKPLLFTWKVAVFTEKQQFSLGNLINQLIQHKSFSFMVCWGKAMYQNSMKTATFHVKSGSFHEKQQFSVSWCAGGRLCIRIPWKLPLFTENRTKDHQLPEMVTPMFIFRDYRSDSPGGIARSLVFTKSTVRMVWSHNDLQSSPWKDKLGMQQNLCSHRRWRVFHLSLKYGTCHGKLKISGTSVGWGGTS